MAEQEPPRAAKFEDAKSYSISLSGRCRLAIHTYTTFVLASVLLMYSFGNEDAFTTWAAATTELFLGLDMWKTRYFSQKEHGTQWATRMLSAAFASLTVVQAVTVGVLNREFAAYSAGAAAFKCVSWYVHAARMRELGFIDKVDDAWTTTGLLLKRLDFHWKVVNGFERNVEQPFDGPKLIIFAYNIILGTPWLAAKLAFAGVLIVWANCLWGFLSLMLLTNGLLTGAFIMLCKVAFNDDFDRLMKAAIAGYKKVDAISKALDLCAPLVAAKERGDQVTPVMIDDLRVKVIALLGPQGHQLLPESLKTVGRIAGRLNLMRRAALTSYEEARRAVVYYLTGNDDGHIVFTAAPTGRLADIAACYDRELADNAKDKELGGIACQFAAKVTFLARYLGKRVVGSGTRQGGIKDDETVELAIRAGPYSVESWKNGVSVCSNEKCPSGIFKIKIGRDAELLSNHYVKERLAMRSELAGAAAYIRSSMWWKFGEKPMDADALGALDIDTVSVQGYVAEFFKVPKSWEVHAKKNSQGLLMGFGVQIWHKLPGDTTWKLMDRGEDSKYWQNFATPTDADLDMAPCYETLTINGARRGPLFAPIWEERLDMDDDNADDTWEQSRDALRVMRDAEAEAAVAAWNRDKTGPPPVFSVLLDDGSGERRCACVAFSSGLAKNGKKRTEDTYEYGPMADEVAKAGGVFVALDDRYGQRADVVLVGRGVEFSTTGTVMTTLKADARVVFVNWQNSEHGAESHPGTPGSLVGRDGAAAGGSLARGRARRDAAPAAATPAAPVESAAELAGAPCFVLDALDAGEPVLDDAAKPFREHYACFERNRTDPADTRIIRIGTRMTGENAHQYFGEFYPAEGYGRWNPGFLPKGPPTTSYP